MCEVNIRKQNKKDKENKKKMKSLCAVPVYYKFISNEIDINRWCIL